MGTTFKMIRLAGEAEASIEAAVEEALSTSGETIRGQSWLQIHEIRANLAEGGGVERWQVVVDVAFEVEKTRS